MILFTANRSTLKKKNAQRMISYAAYSQCCKKCVILEIYRDVRNNDMQKGQSEIIIVEDCMTHMSLRSYDRNKSILVVVL